jgi:hypothetical protein
VEHIPSNADITEISALARRQRAQELELEMLEAGLKLAKSALRQTQEVDLPLAMQQAGVAEIKLPSGEKISIKDDVYATMPKGAACDAALLWLRSHGLGDVIKSEVTVSFGRDEEEQATALLAECQVNGWNNAAFAATVHNQTLKALIRERLAKGAEFPMELFGAGVVTKAVIK